MPKWLDTLKAHIRSAFRTPTAKQKEGYGRFFHTLSAASFIGTVTVQFSRTQAVSAGIVKVDGRAAGHQASRSRAPAGVRLRRG